LLAPRLLGRRAASDDDERSAAVKPIKGHELLFEGRLMNSYLPGNGVGKGRCRCGALSPDLPTTAARKRWHREHKQAILDAQGAQ
jgi:hypothetical protein